MNPLEGLIYGFSVALAQENLVAALIGALLGTFVGVLPGIGPIGAMALLLPTTLTLKPETALIMLAGIFYGAMYGGSTTSILMNVPGEAASIVTTIDGYQMARKGRAGAALAVAACGSFIAGTIGVVGLMLFTPVLADFALRFGPPEFFMIALVGLMTLSRLSGGSMWKGLLMVALGLTLGTVGMEPISGIRRFTFGLVPLTQGIELVPVAMGLFGVAEVLVVAEQAGGLPRVLGVRLRELLPSRSEWGRAIPAMLRGTGIGFMLGLIPGPAPLISTFTAYKVERWLARRPEEFGQGAIEGVAGPESANNAASTATLVPLLGLGVPFAPPAALLLAALMIQGVQPGPLLLQQKPEVFWGVVASMYVGNAALLILNLPLIGMWVSLLLIPQAILLALILVFMLVGTYSVNNSVLDLAVLLCMGLVGYGLRKLRFDVAPLVLGLVLGPFLEKTFRTSLFLGRGDFLIFLKRPISGLLLIFLVTVLIAPPAWKLAAVRLPLLRRRLLSSK